MKAHGRAPAHAHAHPHEKPHHPHWPLASILFAFVLLLGLRSAHEPKTWLHVATGARILEQRAVPRADPFSAGAAGARWSTDSWLADAAMAKADAVGGPRLVVFLKSVVLAFAFALLLPVNHGSPLAAATLLALGALGAWPGFTETPAVFDLLFTALFIRLLRPRARFHWRHAVIVAALTALWANLHGSSAILAVWFVGLKAFKASLRTAARERMGYGILFLAAALAVSWNPHGWGVLARTFVDGVPFDGGWQASWLSLWTLFALAGLGACWMTLQQEFVTTLIAATCVALSFALPALRPLAVLAACPVIALALGHALRPRDDTWPRVLRWSLLAFVLLVAQRVAVAPLSYARGYGAPALDGASHFLRASGVAGRMFNPPELGAELIGLSGRPVFTDGRPGLYTAQFLRDARDWPRLWGQLDGIYRFDYAVLPNRRAGAPASPLDEDPAWRLAYADDGALVYVKRDGPNGVLFTQTPPRLAPPNRLWPESLDAHLTDPRRAAKLLEELDRWQVQAPGAVQPLLWKAYALGRAGLREKAEWLAGEARERLGRGRDPELLALQGAVLQSLGRAADGAAALRRAAREARRRREAATEAAVLERLSAAVEGAEKRRVEDRLARLNASRGER
ncbi:MAG: hypothetical protein SF051_03385 [Elusimicrobiota bacterium]|nr:hypothetical protein [Elusimicrobiota bacterium]